MWQHCVLLQRLFNYLEILWSILSGATIIIPILSMLKWKNRDINFPRVKQAVMVDLGFEPSLSLHYILKGDWAKEPSCLESTFKVTLWEKRGPCQIQIWILALLYYLANEVKSLSHVQLFATPWTVAHQAPPSMKFSRQEYWSGLPFPPPGVLPEPGVEPKSPAYTGRRFYHLSHQGSPVARDKVFNQFSSL